jgi:phosphonoacetaldehyde hydrolase
MVKLQGVILDWAGTIADHGSRAPVSALLDVFTAAGVSITIAEARLSMGLAKKSHIRCILKLPRVREAWLNLHGRLPAPGDVDNLYAEFIPRQIECLKQHSDLIDGVPEAAGRMRSRGFKIGTTTGYTRPMLDYLLKCSHDQGFDPDCSACPDDVPAGRPAPWMCYFNATRLGVYPMWSLVKIGDTPVDIEEGLNAGMWTIGITRTGNEVGLTDAEWRAIADDERQRLLSVAGERLRAAGAHYLADSAAACDEIFDAIDRRLMSRERP